LPSATGQQPLAYAVRVESSLILPTRFIYLLSSLSQVCINL
jgi:hypothetical protein